MNARTRSSAALIEELCPTCGLCCNGVIFANVASQPTDDVTHLQSLGLQICKPRAVRATPLLAQPCAAFDGCRCRIYAERPQYCREFECALLTSVKAGRTEKTAALRVIGETREQADKVRQLLRALGDTDEHLPLRARFRRTTRRLQQVQLDYNKAETYAELTLAAHNLNLLLSTSFYPGREEPKAKKGRLGRAVAAACVVFALFAAPGWLRADQVELQNGDRYIGHVLSLNSTTVVLQSEVLGTVRLPRSKVAVITLGRIAGTNSPALLSLTNAQEAALANSATNASTNLHPVLRQLGASTNVIRQIQKQFLSGAGNEANDKFNELLSGLMSGKLNVDDIRAQAKAAADQLRALQKESGEDTGFAASAYLSILDHFLKESEPPATSTNSLTPSAKPKPPVAPEEN